MCEMHYYRQRRHGNFDVKLLRTIEVDHDRFKRLDDGAAWLMGLIWSDGDLSGKRIGIVSKDKPMIDAAARVLGLTNGVYRRKVGGAWDIRFTSAAMSADLRAMGLHERKSLTIEWPVGLPDHFAWSFLRGLFDGDGSITLSQTRPNQQAPDARLKWLTASALFASQIRHHLSRLGVNHRLYTYRYSRVNALYSVAIVRQADLRAAYSNFYPSPDVPALPRKRDLFRRWHEAPRGKAGNPVLRARGLAKSSAP